MKTALLTTALLLLAPAAYAQDAPPTPTIGKKEESVKFLSTGFTFGGHGFMDSNITAAYGGAPVFLPRLSVGLVPWSKYVHFEVRATAGVGIIKGTQTVVSTGASSADTVGLSIFPLTIDLLVGIDIIDEQPVVPYGGAGIAWTPWRETEADEDSIGPGSLGDLIARGDRFGFNAFFGAGFLLDNIEPSRASRLDAKAGVNDTFLIVEARRSWVKSQLQDGEWDQSGLDFSGWSFHVGIKMIH